MYSHIVGYILPSIRAVCAGPEPPRWHKPAYLGGLRITRYGIFSSTSSFSDHKLLLLVRNEAWSSYIFPVDHGLSAHMLFLLSEAIGKEHSIQNEFPYYMEMRSLSISCHVWLLISAVIPIVTDFCVHDCLSLLSL